MTDNRGAQALRRRVSKGTTQAMLADQAGVSQSQISRLLAGEKPPKLREDALRLRAAFGIEVEWWDEPAEPEAGDAA